MSRLPLTAAAAALILAACTPPEPVPPPRFKPNPPYPPQPVDPYGNSQTTDPNGQPSDADPFLHTRQVTPTPDGDYPIATPTGNPNEVISPFEPREPIDVTGFSSGELARDPRNRRIFRVP